MLLRLRKRTPHIQISHFFKITFIIKVRDEFIINHFTRNRRNINMGKEKKLTRIQEGAKCGNTVSVLRMTKEDKINKILELQSGSQKFDNNINNNSNRIFRAADQDDVDIINSIKKKYNAGKTRNAACAMGNINGENIEYLRVKYKDNPNVTGEIEIISERIFCDNCNGLVDMFEKEFPNIKVTRVEIVK